MTSPQNLDATFCLFASLISKQSANPAQLKRDLEAGAKHFQASNPELGSLLQRMSDAVKNIEGLSARDTASVADHALGHALGLQALLFALLRSIDNSHEVLANYQSEIESARVALLELAPRTEARSGLDEFHAAVINLQKEL